MHQVYDNALETVCHIGKFTKTHLHRCGNKKNNKQNIESQEKKNK